MSTLTASIQHFTEVQKSKRHLDRYGKRKTIFFADVIIMYTEKSEAYKKDIKTLV